LRATGAVESPRAATSKYNDNRNVVTTLNDVGNFHVGLGLPQQALIFFEEKILHAEAVSHRGAYARVARHSSGARSHANGIFRRILIHASRGQPEYSRSGFERV
jgi:hypothetical protein